MQYAKQSDESFEIINQLIWKHLEERDWLNAKLHHQKEGL